MPTPSRPSPFATVLALLPLLATPAPCQQDVKKPAPVVAPVPEDRRAGFDSIDPALCKEWLTYLSSDELEGRETGKPGYKKAADFIAKKFEAFGLKPVGDAGTYFQAVPWAVVQLVPQETQVALLDSGGKAVLELPLGRGFGGRMTEKSTARYELLLIKAETAAQLKQLDVRGKAVLLVDASKATPQRGRRRGRRFSSLAYQLRVANAATVVMVDDGQAMAPIDTQGRSRYTGPSYGRARRSFRTPNSYAVTRAAAQQLLTAAGTEVELDTLEAGKPVAFEGFELETRVVVKQEPVFAANVVGYLEGRDPELKHEVVGIGSHLDHVGINARGQIRNGADDDGSGTTGVLAVARAFTLNKVRPRRSILFMCFSGEEKGLIGSRYYANNPIFPNKDMVAEIQMDMIGRNEEKRPRNGRPGEAAADNLNSLHLVGTKKLSMDLHQICIGMNEAHVGFDFEYDEEGVFYRSDHANFAMKDIPIAFLFTGFHPQYHQPDDTVEKIDFPKLVRVAKLAYAISWEVAERKERPKLDRRWKDVARQRRRR